MIDATIVRLTMRQLLGQKRTILMLGFALIPVLIAVLYNLNGDHSRNDPQEWTAKVVLSGLVVGLTLPFTSLVFGTAALGTEFEDGTAVYLLSKPIPRETIVLSKLLVAWAATIVVVLIATIPAGYIALSGEAANGIVLGFAVAVVAGALIYCSAFLWLSIATSRALIAGLLYVFIWEGVVVNLFRGVRLFSVRQYTLGIEDGLTGGLARSTESVLAPGPAAIGAAVVLVVAFAIATLELSRSEIRAAD
jgi:ABC-2 type transport system permease protein